MSRWVVRLIQVLALGLAPAALADAPPPAKPAASAAPVALGDDMKTVIAKLGDPLGVMNGGGSSALMYPDGQIEMRDNKVSRIRWKGVVIRETATPVRLARATAGAITVRKVDPNIAIQKARAEREAELAKMKETNTKIKVVSTHQTNGVFRVEPETKL